MEILKVFWKNKEVGQLIDPVPDMWYLEGDWKSNETEDSRKFENLMKSIDAKEVFSGLTKGLELILKENESTTELPSVGISLDNDKLFVRRIFKPYAKVVDKKEEVNKLGRVLAFLKLK